MGANHYFRRLLSNNRNMKIQKILRFCLQIKIKSGLKLLHNIWSQAVGTRKWKSGLHFPINIDFRVHRVALGYVVSCKSNLLPVLKTLVKLVNYIILTKIILHLSLIRKFGWHLQWPSICPKNIYCKHCNG